MSEWKDANNSEGSSQKADLPPVSHAIVIPDNLNSLFTVFYGSTDKWLSEIETAFTQLKNSKGEADDIAHKVRANLTIKVSDILKIIHITIQNNVVTVATDVFIKVLTKLYKILIQATKDVSQFFFFSKFLIFFFFF